MIVTGVLERLRPITEKGCISYGDLAVFRHYAEFALKVQAPESVPGLEAWNDNELIKDEATHPAIFQGEDTNPAGLATAVGSEYPVRIVNV